MARNIGDNLVSNLKMLLTITGVLLIIGTVAITMLLTPTMGDHPQPDPPAGYVAG